MKRYLFLLRHAEAEQDDTDGDINRPLTERGKKSVGAVGDDLQRRGERVQKIFSSTAVRAAQTARGICSYLGYVEQDIGWRQELYLPGLNDLLVFLAACPPGRERLMLVGHNPGLQNLMTYLAAADTLPVDKSLSTAALAKLEIGEDWESLRAGSARLIYLIRPNF